MNDREIHFRIQQRPTMPPLIAMSILLVLVGATVAVYQWVAENFGTFLIVFGIPIATIFIYTRLPFSRRVNRRVLAVFLISCAAVIATLVVKEKHKEQKRRDELHARHYAPCQNFISEISQGKSPRNYNFDFCSSYMTTEQAVELCRPKISQVGYQQTGWARCQDFAHAILPFPK